MAYDRLLFGSDQLGYRAEYTFDGRAILSAAKINALRTSNLRGQVQLPCDGNKPNSRPVVGICCGE